MSRVKSVLAICLIAVASAALISGAQRADPETPTALPGLPVPFLGTSLVGGGDSAIAAIDSYGDVVDLRLGGPGGTAQIKVNRRRQIAGTVENDSGIVPMTSSGTRATSPPWMASSVTQHYLTDTNVLITTSRVGGARMRIADAADGSTMVRRITVRTPRGIRANLGVGIKLTAGQGPAGCTGSPDSAVSSDGANLSWHAPGLIKAAVSCTLGSASGVPASASIIDRAARADRRWVRQASGLRGSAPDWAMRMYRRSLLVIRALTDPATGAQIAGLRDGWDSVWPRDAATGAIALSSAGFETEARRSVRFLAGLNTDEAARFRPDGSPVNDGRELQGDGAGWIHAAALAAGVAGVPAPEGDQWRDRGDYGERADESGDLLGNAIAGGAGAAEILDRFGYEAHLVRKAGDDDSGFDAAAAWAIAPFPRPALFASARRTLGAVLPPGSPYGIPPSSDWGSDDPWSAPTAWTAWSTATLGDRAIALELMQAIRRSQTPTGMIPERVGPDTGLPRSTTPLAWSHALAIMALEELWPRSPMVPGQVSG